MATNELTPDAILQTGLSFFAAKSLLSAVELGLFGVLGDKAMTGAELAGALKLHPRANPDFFDALLSTGMLARDGDGPNARYRNTPETALFLDRSKPTYVGGILEMANTRLYRFWADLTEALKTGSRRMRSSMGARVSSASFMLIRRGLSNSSMR